MKKRRNKMEECEDCSGMKILLSVGRLRICGECAWIRSRPKEGICDDCGENGEITRFRRRRVCATCLNYEPPVELAFRRDPAEVDLATLPSLTRWAPK